MMTTFGEFKEGFVFGGDYVNITLFAEDFPLKWSHAALSADFMVDYFGSLFPDEAGPDSSALHDGSASGPKPRRAARAQVAGVMSFVLNELIENAVKFRCGGDIVITLGFDGHDMVLLIANEVLAPAVPAFQERLGQITTEDPGDLLIRRIEENAAGDGDEGSGLGYLSLINDYGVRLGWKFEPAGGELENQVVHVMARLSVKRGEV